MGRKYGFGKYGDGSYDLEFDRPIVILIAADTIIIPISVSGDFKTDLNFKGSVTFVVDTFGNFGHMAKFDGSVDFGISVVSLDEEVGPPWQPIVPELVNIADIWIPTTHVDFIPRV